MKKPKIFSEEVIKEFIKLGIFIFIFSINKSSTSTPGQEMDFTNIMEDSGIIIITSIIYFMMFWILNIIKKPIKIIVDLKNLANNKNVTTLCRSGVSREDISTITININILETRSVWNKVALRILKNFKICLCIHSLPQNESLVCQPNPVARDIENADDGFIIDISSLIHGNLEYRTSLGNEYNFVVKENRDYPFQSNRDIPIKTYLLINRKKLNLFYKLLCNFSYSEKEGDHIVEFIK